jgi:hypothetical protein
MGPRFQQWPALIPRVAYFGQYPEPDENKREQVAMSKSIAASCRVCSGRAAAEAPLVGIVIVLQRNHQSLHRLQRPQRDNED